MQDLQYIAQEMQVSETKKGLTNLQLSKGDFSYRPSGRLEEASVRQPMFVACPNGPADTNHKESMFAQMSVRLISGRDPQGVHVRTSVQTAMQ